MEYRMYIDGKWCDADSGQTSPVVDPATEEVIREVPYGGGAEATRAIDAAAAAWPKWAALTVYQRASYLLKTAQLIREHAPEIARTVTREVGKPVAESLGEVNGTADQFEWYSEEVKRVGGEVIPNAAPEKRYFTLRKPVGVVATIAPWNFPLLLIVRKMAPALAAGCTVIARPASGTPLSTFEMFNLLAEVGYPAGVVNLINGRSSEQGAEFLQNRKVRKISFTGSSGVGKKLMRGAADQLKKLSLELGGHAPYIVYDDVDPVSAAKKATFSKFRNMGQVCISPSRFFVQEAIYDKFVEAAVAEVKSFKLGHGLDEGTTHGPLADQGQVDHSQTLVDDIKAQGGEILVGGKRAEGFDKGFFFEPTIAVGLKQEMKIMTEEPFCPVMPIIPFKTEEDAIREGNNTPYGLAAYILTNSLSRAVKTVEGLDAGVIALNDLAPAAACCPFGGMKESGMGREGWRNGIEEYYETKYVSMNIEPD
jgi:succinate-semialdehyde dehydrogenase / glutarate-semialdehyde dehydrogenase